jgi:hypothetical protein
MPRRIRPGHALAALLIVAAGPASAALSPYYQSIAEIQRILDDPRLSDALPGQQAIMSITTTGTDVYEVKTARCAVTVTIVGIPPKEGEPIMVGPRQFDLQFGEGKCE